ncbi:MAG TPA: M81 family metallopeptidase [Bryobacteraceae bacterium]|nr:M81 family metallopeptidase [Bryobacteraceae bacterium]
MRSFWILILAAVQGIGSMAWSQQHKPRIAVGGLSAESNSLYPRITPMRESAPVSREVWLAEAAKANTVPSGIVAAAGKLGLDVYPVLRAGASFLGSVEKSSFDEKLNELVRQIKTANPPFDGVILTQHGAMVVDGYPQGDAEVVRRVRQAMGRPFPIVVTHDFHSNVCRQIVDDSDVLITYKENPHLDPKERGMQAATILAGMIRGTVKPVQVLAKPPMIVNIVFQDTFHAPYKPIVDESRRLEKTNPKILAVSVPGGYQWGDVPDMGPGVIVVTDNDRALAEREAKRLSAMLWAMRERLVFRVPDAAAAVKDAIASTRFPVALMDTGDNIGGGSAGDGTTLLAELMRQKAEGWVVVISDKEANQAAFQAGVGEPFDQRVGGKTDRMHGDPVRVVGRVKSLNLGRYVETEVRHGGGRYSDMGLTSVIEVEGSTPDLPNLLLLTNRPTSPNSLHQLISNGVYPQRQKILVAKGTTAPRAAYEPVSARIVEVNTPGATDVNPARFTYKNVRRPLFGLE